MQRKRRHPLPPLPPASPDSRLHDSVDAHLVPTKAVSFGVIAVVCRARLSTQYGVPQGLRRVSRPSLPCYADRMRCRVLLELNVIRGKGIVLLDEEVRYLSGAEMSLSVVGAAIKLSGRSVSNGGPRMERRPEGDRAWFGEGSLAHIYPELVGCGGGDRGMWQRYQCMNSRYCRWVKHVLRQCMALEHRFNAMRLPPHLQGDGAATLSRFMGDIYNASVHA